MEANLHIHSRFSDGSLWPSEIAEKAQKLDLELVSVTDHDTLGGVSEFLAHAAWRGIAALPGCELDCEAGEIGYKSELLAYFPAGTYPATEAFLRSVALRRAERLKELVSRARRAFHIPDLSFEELFARKYGPRAEGLDPGQASLSKVDFFFYVKERGAIPEALGYRDFRRDYLDSKDLGEERFVKASAAELASLVKADGGVLVIPHIGHEFDDSAEKMRAEVKRLRRVFSYFKELGAAGVEQYYYRNEDSEAINALVRREAGRLGLFLTYGSDCHGPGSGKDTLGQFSGDFPGFPGFPPPRA
jgi:predicted metal-dependent phosphoesterase TrpH